MIKRIFFTILFIFTACASINASESLIERAKFILGGLGQGKKNQRECGEGYQLRESSVPSGVFWGAEKDYIRLKNSCFWNDNPV